MTDYFKGLADGALILGAILYVVEWVRGAAAIRNLKSQDEPR